MAETGPLFSSSLDDARLLRVRATVADEATCSQSDTAPVLTRARSASRLLDLRDVNIAEEVGPDGVSGDVSGSRPHGGGAGHGDPQHTVPPVSTPRAAPSISLPKQNRETLRHFAIDIGGSLIKLVYFSPNVDNTAGGSVAGAAVAGGRLHFLKFETTNVEECIRFIEAKGLHKCSTRRNGLACVKATGGGAFRFNELFQERLGITLEKEDEMASLVGGANFLLQELRDEAFTFAKGQRKYLSHLPDAGDLFPYLLVNIGSGVSILRVTQDGFERVSGTNMGGGTFWGLCRLLTGCRDFDAMLELSAKGKNANIDMLVGDIYGGHDYSKALGLSASTIASSFGKVVMDSDKTLADYKPEDLALSLLRMISYNIAHIAVLNAMRFGLKRIFFGGFFIRGHAYTMDIISYAINFWSKGELSAHFMRHEGFLGALGAFLRHYESELPDGGALANRRGSWIERFKPHGASGAAAPPFPSGAALPWNPLGQTLSGGSSGSADNLQVGVLHLIPSLEPFPLLAHGGEGSAYVPDTLDLVGDAEERGYWLDVLGQHLPSLVDKAVASDGGTPASVDRGAAFHATFSDVLARIAADPDAYGRLSLAGILEMREEALRSFGFRDAFAEVKRLENEAALGVLPDLLAELDALESDELPQALIEGVLAGNIFDWGSRACVELYQNGTILEIYRHTRSSLTRPWGVDHFDALKSRLLDSNSPFYSRALLFCDNSGADVVLGMLPLARYLLSRGCDVILVANDLPALNDITVRELAHVLDTAAGMDEQLAVSLKAASECGSPGACASPGLPARLWTVGNGHGSPCLDLRRVSADLCAASRGTDLVVLVGMGRAVHTNWHAHFKCDVLKAAMIKNARLAHKIFGGKLYDCVCLYEPKEDHTA